MQVRAYNFWAAMLDGRNFPSIEDLDPQDLPDFGPYSVLLDFTGGIDNPAVQFLGDTLAEECGDGQAIRHLADVPARSLLSRITDHYMQILANQAPIGFEAEFVNQRESTILYRGILLPFSSDDETIDFIYGVINWKELADQKATESLLLEVEQALEAPAEPIRHAAPMPEWADGPADEPTVLDPNVLDLGAPLDEEVEDFDWPEPEFGSEGYAVETASELPEVAFGEVVPDEAPLTLDLVDEIEDDELEDDELDLAAFSVPELEPELETETGEAVEEPVTVFELEVAEEELPVETAPIVIAAVEPEFAPAEAAPAEAFAELDLGAFAAEELDPEDMGLADWLASARELAQAAQGSEDRTRDALYDAIGRAFDFSIADADAPEEFDELLVDSGLTVQDRAPMTPVVKLVFGADYDKTRLTEYASALSHAHRLGLARGELTGFLSSASGGLKGVVNAERRLKREESGKAVEPLVGPRETLARKLRKLDHMPLSEVSSEGSEFTLLIARRLPDGEVVLLGEVSDDVPLLERAARRLLA